MNKERLIVISGGGGYIGRSLIQRIINKTKWNIVAFSSSLVPIPDYEGRVLIRKNEEIDTWMPTMQGIDTCIHLAFSRRFRSNTDIALSLDFSAAFYKSALECGGRLINVSSVGVYGLNSGFPDERTTPAPDSLYSMAKYSSEVLMQSYFRERGGFTNIRLSGIAQSQRILPIFIENAKTTGVIQISGGKQQFSWIDILDAADAFIALIAYDGEWRNVYNVSLNKSRYSIVDLAEIVSRVAVFRGYKKTKVVLTPSDERPICVGWNSEMFINDTGWEPMVTITETVEKMF